MVNPLQYFDSFQHPLGQEIDLTFTTPETLPTSYTVYIFKKEGSDIMQTEIDNYFAGSPPANVTVFQLQKDADDKTPFYMDDLTCDNGKTYYYKGVVKDDTSGTVSTPVGDNATANTTATTKIVDAKQEIIKLVKRTLKNYGMDERKHYHLSGEYGLEIEKTPALYVVRTGGNVASRFVGALKEFTNGLHTYGEIDLDIIQIIWEDPSAVRRDKLTNIFRENKEAIRQYLLHPKGSDMIWADITMEGDAINQSVRDRIQVSGMMTVACGIEIDQTYTDNMASWIEATQTNME